MSKTLSFHKMEGLGNDFIVTGDVSAEETEQIRGSFEALCHRRTGIGADGVILVLPSQTADFTMRIFNSDGSEAEMCGNGIRCFAKYLQMHNLTPLQEVKIQTLAGTIMVSPTSNDCYRVNMGKPVLDPSLIPLNTELIGQTKDPFMMREVKCDDKTFKISALSMGNPHAVLYTENLTDQLVNHYGPILESHGIFPRKTNVEFIKVLSDNEIQMRVYERGCGETQACGTGACAAAVSGVINKMHGKKVTVHLLGGDLHIEWQGEETDPVFMTGPAKEVFRGSVKI
ncbi:Diaminopimelate epimerase [Chitinispirillum alkaliphilum]|nr:Diaminopimelate epimerase [Chitinispirillum alkaliphilum]